MPVPCEWPSPIVLPRTTAFSPTPRKDADRFLILARDFHFQQDEIDRKKCDLAELRAEELHIREKFGLLEDTPLHDVTRRGSPLM